MKERFECKRLKSNYEKGLYVVIYIIVLIRQFITFFMKSTSANLATFFLLHCYIILVMIVFYDGVWYNKLILYGIFNLCELLAFAIATGIALLFCPNLMSHPTVLCYQTAIYTILMMVIFIFIIYILFFKNKRATDQIIRIKEIFPFITMILLMYIPILLVYVEAQDTRYHTKGFEWYILFVQIFAVILTIYIALFLYQNKKKVGIVEEKLQSAEKIIELTSNIHELRHDMMFHVNVLLDLLYKEKNEEAIKYIENTFNCVRVLENTFNLSDPAISSSLNLIAQKAKDKQITFNYFITVEEFKIPSHEMCSLLLNILSNAMDAAEKTSKKRRTVCLEIAPVDGGYHINCMNTYKDRPVFDKGRMKSSKSEEGHGKGIGIIKNIVEKHGGAMDITIHEESKLFEINCFIPK